MSQKSITFSSDAINEIGATLSDFDKATLNSGAYSSWVALLFELKNDFPERFKEAFTGRRKNRIEDAVVEYFLKN